MKAKIAEDTRKYSHFLAVKNKLILGTGDIDNGIGYIFKILDRVYNIDPNTPFSFKR
jgi:hypothetical protein